VAEPRRRGSTAFVAFLLTLITLAVTAGYALWMGGAQLAREKLAEWSDPRREVSLIEIVIDGETRLLRPDAAIALVPGLTARLDERLPALIAETDARIAIEVDRAFAPALERIPRFTDWYYSLRGEYGRYLSALTADLPGFMTQRLTEEVIDPSGLETALDGLQEALAADLARRVRAESRWALGALTELTEAGAVPLETDAYRGRVSESMELGAVLREGLDISEQELGRQALAALAGAGAGTLVATGLGAVVVKKLVAKLMGTGGMKLAVALLGKFLVKAGVKGGGSAAAAAAGITLCAPGGLLAIGCGVVAGVATWVLVDKAFIEIEEALDRETFEADLRAAVLAERDHLKQRLSEAYAGVVREQYAKLARQLVARTPAPLRPALEHDFIPAAPANRSDD
jgi:hypothetical protein